VHHFIQQSFNISRPELNDKISLEDFINFYWLKKELSAFCKTKGINATGGKIEISSRIKTFLLTGEIIKQAAEQKEKVTSTYNWSNAAYH